MTTDVTGLPEGVSDKAEVFLDLVEVIVDQVDLLEVDQPEGLIAESEVFMEESKLVTDLPEVLSDHANLKLLEGGCELLRKTYSVFVKRGFSHGGHPIPFFPQERPEMLAIINRCLSNPFSNKRVIRITLFFA